MDINVEARVRAGIERLNPHRRNWEPSPHKSLLLLWAVRRRVVRPEASRLFRYAVTEQPMYVLLAAAGSSTPPRPWYPYVRLRSSDFWELSGNVPLNSAGDVISARAVKDSGAEAGFRSEFDPVLLDAKRAAVIEDCIVGRWLDPTVVSSVMTALDHIVWEE
jgi:hypothetical protein